MGYTLLAGFILGGLIGMGVATPSNQDILDRFVDPVCVAQKIGADFITKCYTIKELDELTLTHKESTM